jgi:hypothetical protein
LFAAFAPALEPEIVVVALVEHAGAGGGKVAAPIVQKVLARYFEKHPPEPDPGETQVVVVQDRVAGQLGRRAGGVQ